MTRLYAMAAAVAMLALLGGLFAYVQLNRPDDEFAQCRQGQIAGGDIGGPFTLVNMAGQTVTDADVLTRPSLVYFGYTFCPDVCPFDVVRNVHPGLIALTGSADQVRTASQAYKTYYRKQDTGDEFYRMDHTTFTYLMLPGTGFVDFFRRELTSEELAESVSCFLEAKGAAS